MRLSAQEHLLSGETALERFSYAQSLGLDGVEVFADASFEDRMSEIADAMAKTNVAVSAINVRHTTLIHPDPMQRENALTLIRRALSWSTDLNAAGVIFMGHYAPFAVLPDLTPYKSAVELEAELLIRQLGATLCDFANAIDSMLLLEHASTGETHLLRRAGFAAIVREKLQNHGNLFVTANVYHMLAEGDVPASTLHELGDALHYVHLSDSLHGLDFTTLDMSSIITALNEMRFDGWLCLEAPSESQTNLKASLKALQELLRH